MPSFAPAKQNDTIDIANAEVILFEKLGSGGSGASVYRCSVNGFTCAVKILRNPDGEILKYFQDEISLLESLR